MAKCKNKKHSFTARRATSRSRFVAGRPVWSQGSPARVPALPQGLVLSVLRAQPLASSDRAWRFNMQQSKTWVTLFSYHCSCYSHHRTPPCGRGSHKARASETGDAIQQKRVSVTWQVELAPEHLANRFVRLERISSSCRCWLSFFMSVCLSSC